MKKNHSKRKQILLGYLRLMRPANLPTAAADVLAGVAMAGIFAVVPVRTAWTIDIGLLILATVFLYAGGVVLNDVFDVEIDRTERPERPIPSGLIRIASARAFGLLLLALGVGLGFLVNVPCGSTALILALAILIYDKYSKHNAFLGPINMGICRGLNLLLGMAILGEIDHAHYAVLPIIYIAAITLISRGEVKGGNRKHVLLAGLLYAMVIAGLLGLLLSDNRDITWILPFLLIFGILIYRPLLRVYRKPSALNTKKAVIAGVLSIIVLDASLAAAFSYWWIGALILLLLPLSGYLAKRFAVT